MNAKYKICSMDSPIPLIQYLWNVGVRYEPQCQGLLSEKFAYLDEYQAIALKLNFPTAKVVPHNEL